jgi:hypothetical protein
MFRTEYETETAFSEPPPPNLSPNDGASCSRIGCNDLNPTDRREWFCYIMLFYLAAVGCYFLSLVSRINAAVSTGRREARRSTDGKLQMLVVR